MASEAEPFPHPAPRAAAGVVRATGARPAATAWGPSSAPLTLPSRSPLASPSPSQSVATSERAGIGTQGRRDREVVPSWLARS